MKYLNYLVLLIAFNSTAQQVDLTWAEKIKTKGNAFVLGGNENFYYTGHVNNDDYLVCRKYNTSMEVVKEQVVPFELDEKRYSYKNSIFLKNKIVHIIKEHKRKEDKDVLYASFTDLDLKNNDKSLILDETGEDERTSFFGSNYISPDSTKILIFHEKNGRKKDPSRLSFKVYKSDFSDVLLDKLVEIPIKDRNFSTKSISVDNLGNVYVLANVFREKKERVKGQSADYYKLIVFDKTTGAPKEFDFDFENQSITSIDIIPSKNNTFICTGFLGDIEQGFLSKRVSNISDEMFSAILDCNNLTLSSTFKLKVEGLYPDKVRKTQDFVPYKVKDIFPKPDGGYVVVAEQYKLIVTTTSSANGMTHTTYRYYYCDIACMQVDKNGKLESITKVPKYQLNASNPSIISTHLDGKTYIIYEDLAKNLEAETDKETKKSSKSWLSSDSKNALFLLTIDASGKPKKDIIYDYKESKIRPKIRASVLINPSTIIVNANDQIGKLKFK
ncbi:MAG: hypothetical protein EOO46_03380 [Flavobacterium sp.]|nr:MAG: hypothetical protein EOO46_03380 [Flavobacterium sp.]